MSSPTPAPWGDIDKVFAASPTNLLTIGGLWVAPYGTTLPTDVDTPLDVLFKNLGFISDKGVKVTIADKTKSIDAWGGDQIMTLRDTYAIQYGMDLFQVLSPEVNAAIFGADHVSTAEATAMHGARMKVLLNKQLPPRCSLVLDAFYEDKAIRQVAALAQRGDMSDITLVHNEPMTFTPTFNVLKGRDGNHVIQYTDDGILAAS